MDQYDYFVAALSLVAGGILGMVIVFELYEEFKNGR